MKWLTVVEAVLQEQLHKSSPTSSIILRRIGNTPRHGEWEHVMTMPSLTNRSDRKEWRGSSAVGSLGGLELFPSLTKVKERADPRINMEKFQRPQPSLRTVSIITTVPEALPWYRFHVNPLVPRCVVGIIHSLLCLIYFAYSSLGSLWSLNAQDGITPTAALIHYALQGQSSGVISPSIQYSYRTQWAWKIFVPGPNGSGDIWGVGCEVQLWRDRCYMGAGPRPLRAK